MGVYDDDDAMRVDSREDDEEEEIGQVRLNARARRASARRRREGAEITERRPRSTPHSSRMRRLSRRSRGFERARTVAWTRRRTRGRAR